MPPRTYGKLPLMGPTAVDEGKSVRNGFLIKAGIIVGSGGLIFGYDIGVIAGVLSKVRDVFNLSPFEEGLVVSILYVGSILGAIIGGPLCDFLGRWKTIHIQNVVFIVGSLVTGLAPDLPTLCIGRFIVGIASALSGIADVPYLNEIAPAHYRGILSSQYEMAISIGVLLSFVGALALSGVDNGWRIAFLIPSVGALLQSMGMFLLPDSPKWLQEKGYLNKAGEALLQIYGDDFIAHCSAASREDESVPEEVRSYLLAVDMRVTEVVVDDLAEVSALQQAVGGSPYREGGGGGGGRESALSKGYKSGHTASHKSHGKSHGQKSISASSAMHALVQEEKEVLKQYLYPVYLIIAVQILAQATGGNVIRNYAPTIFESGGVSTDITLTLNLVLGVIKVLSTAISILYIEKVGRLNLLLYSVYLVGFGMLFLALCSLAPGDDTAVVTFTLGCACVYFGFGLGYGPIPWVISTEFVPTLIRGRIIAVSQIASNASQLLVNLIFLPMVAAFTSCGAFMVFVVISLGTLVFVKLLMVESKQIAPEEVLQLLLVKYDESSALLCRREQLLSPDRRGQQLISPGGKDPGTPGSDGSFGSPAGAGAGLGGGGSGGDKVYDSHSMGHSLSGSMGDSHNSHNPMLREREDELMGSTV
ncbi:major facilitator superfamily domain-containing protein [Ochromonadaceae sp. CCMP2298]|nr:major facilitator superfamily domain-containing protein [Ochromonadaceae sp. CCMP2298]